MNIITPFFWRAVTAAALCFLSLCGLGQRPGTVQAVTGNGSLAGVDALGRQTVSSGQSEKQVGLFYFLWCGAHGTDGPYDNTKIAAAHPEALLSEEAWLAAGGGGLYAHHHWGEPLFGYYTNTDAWVYRKHCQMLTDAGVDFLVFDATNTYIYEEAIHALLAVWYEYFEAGWPVPKLAFYTNTDPGLTMNKLYDAYYNNAALGTQYPRLDELWYRWSDSEKPFIVGDTGDPALRPEVRDYFHIKRSQWPNAAKQADGFPWMEFDRSLTLNAFYGRTGRALIDLWRSDGVMNVSGAQHSDTVRMSAAAWYGGNDRGRAWHNGGNDPSEEALLGGANFAEQWDFTRALDPDVVFITGFNEWVAQRQPPRPGEPIVFVDSADTAFSRDTEPSAGLLGDNYYMQMVDEIRNYKNSVDRKAPGGVSVYVDYENDTLPRDAAGFGGTPYQDSSGRNDIIRMTVACDNINYIFTVETKDALTPSTDPNWMTLFINVNGGSSGWEGYDYVIGRETPGLVEQSLGGWNWEAVEQSEWSVEGNVLTVKVACDLLFPSFQFKWADNYTPGDVYSFYTRGDAAPIGRLNYCWQG